MDGVDFKYVIFSVLPTSFECLSVANRVVNIENRVNVYHTNNEMSF